MHPMQAFLVVYHQCWVGSAMHFLDVGLFFNAAYHQCWVGSAMHLLDVGLFFNAAWLQCLCRRACSFKPACVCTRISSDV